MDHDILAAEEQEKKNYVETDPFAWANNVLQYKEELKFEIFLINKNYMLYKTSLAPSLREQQEVLFIDGLLEYLFEGAETGMVVRGFERAEAEKGVLQRTQTFKVPNIRETLRWIHTQESEIENFDQTDGDLGKIKGMLVRVKHPDMKHEVYVAKVLPGSNVMQGKTGWMVKNGKFVPFDAEAALRIPADNQMLFIDQDVYVFSQARLGQLFSYNAKEAMIAEKKVAEIDTHFKLSFPEGQSLQTMVEGKKSAIKKLQDINPTSVTQDKLIDHASEMGVELMEDDAGSIIIMDDKDMSKFVNLLNDDYMESALTGERYEIIKKRPLKPTEPETDATDASKP